MLKITVGWMYPNLLNLHGERGSIQALCEIGKNMGVDIEVLRIEDFDDPIPFEKLDLMVFLEPSGFVMVITSSGNISFHAILTACDENALVVLA